MGDPQEDNATKICKAFEKLNVDKFEELHLNENLGSYQSQDYAIAEAEKRLKKLERDSAHAQKKYIEAQAERRSFYAEIRHALRRNQYAEYRFWTCKRLIEELQEGIDELSSKAIPKESKSSDNSLRLLMLHGSKSLAKEKILLQQKAKGQKQEDGEITCATVDFIRFINFELDFRLERGLGGLMYKCAKPGSTVRDLLSEFRSTKKSKKEAIANGALDGNLTTQEHLIKSMETEVRLLKKLMCEFEKDNRESEQELLNARKRLVDAEEKERRLEEKSKDLHKRCEEEKIYFLKLKKKRDFE